MLKTLTFGFLLTTGLQAWQSTTTLGFPNGRMWNRLTAGEKKSYLAGYGEEATRFADSKAPDGDGKELEGEYFPGSLTFGDIAKSLDEFYKTPENLNIPIRYALRVLAMKVAGKPDARVQGEVLFERCYTDYVVRNGNGIIPESILRTCLEVANPDLFPKPQNDK